MTSIASQKSILAEIGAAGTELARQRCTAFRFSWQRVVPLVLILAVTGAVASCTPMNTPQGSVTANTVQELRPLAQQGNRAAQIKLGNLYATGTGVPQNTSEAMKWYKAAWDQGEAAGAVNLGLLYYTGTGIAKNPSEAVAWYRRGAEAGNAAGQFLLGTLYQRGEGIPQDYAEALIWYRKAAAQNQIDAENELGYMYLNGLGVPTDPDEGVKWLRLAAEKGQASAQNNLGWCYQNGKGVTKDNFVAYIWYNLSAAKIKPPTLANVMAARDALAKTLSADELQRAQSIARDWKPGVDITASIAASGATNAATVSKTAGAAPAAMNKNLSLRETGTGIALDKGARVLTNDHVIAQCTEARIRPLNGAPRPASIGPRDRTNDLAILNLDAPLDYSASFRDSPIRQGEPIVAYGFPLTGLLASDGNLTTGNITALSGIGNDSRMMQIAAPVQPGNSGGPLVDMSGNVVGVVSSKLNAVRAASITGDIPQNINFAIKASVVRGFFESNGIAFVTAPSNRDLKAADVGERLKKFTVLVECWR
jgi:TPR repeat protein